MKENLFRKESLDKINSPDQLNDYIRCVQPSVWVILGAIIILLIGFFIWALAGSIDGVSPIYYIFR